MNEKPTGTYHHGDLRRALIEAALEIVGTKGVDALTLRSVSRMLGVSHAAPVYHFPTKGDLIIAVAQEGFRKLADRLEAACEGPVEGRIIRVGVAYLDFARENPNHYRVMFGPELSAVPTKNESFMQESDRAFAALATISGEPMLPEAFGATSLHLWSLVHGLVMLKMGPLRHRLPPGSDEWFYEVMKQVLKQAVAPLERQQQQSSI